MVEVPTWICRRTELGLGGRRALDSYVTDPEWEYCGETQGEGKQQLKREGQLRCEGTCLKVRNNMVV